MKTATIIAAAALGLSACTGPGLEPPFGGGDDEGLEPNGIGGGTSSGDAADAGSQPPAAQREDADAGTDDD